MRISDWSSDVCSSDLGERDRRVAAGGNLCLVGAHVRRCWGGCRQERQAGDGTGRDQTGGSPHACVLLGGTSRDRRLGWGMTRGSSVEDQRFPTKDRKSTRLNSSH